MVEVYLAGVKEVFLQAPLDEKIFVKAPPGYDSVDPNTGEQVVWELSKSAYGLKHSSVCFWSAMDKHSRANGFESMSGGPCLFRKKVPGGKVILAVIYVGYCTFAVSGNSGHGQFMSVLRLRFKIDESKERLIDFLIVMAMITELECWDC